MVDLERIIRRQRDGPVMICGYRSMWHTIRIKHSIFIPRKTVEVLLQQIDPESVGERKRHKLKRREYISPGPSFFFNFLKFFKFYLGSSEQHKEDFSFSL